MSYPWGEQLRAFRLKAGYETLGQFADALSALEEPVYLDSSTLSRYENEPSRMPKQRERHFLLAQALVEGGGLESVDEVNGWLASGGLGHLTPEEAARIFPQTTVTLAAQPEGNKGHITTAVLPSSPPPPVRTRPATSRHPFLFAFAGLAGIIAILLFIGSFYAPADEPALVQAPAETGTAVLTPTPPAPDGNLLRNDSFEADMVSSWTAANCTLKTFAPEANRARAKAGEQYLVAATDTADCYSFRQDVTIPATVTDTVSFGVYARSANETPRLVTLVIWTGTGTEGAFTWSEPDYGRAQFVIGGNEWHCLEISLTFPAQRYTQLRAEIYLDTPDGQAYEFDEAWLKAGSGGGCPPPSDQLRNSNFEGRSAYPWIGLSDCSDILTHVQAVDDALEGKQVAVAVGQNDACRSFFQDVAHTPVLSETYTFSIWARSPTGEPLQGVISLWARHDNRAEQGHGVPFLIGGQDWHCLDVQITINQTNSTELRPELYLNTFDTPYEFDQAQLSLQTNSPCPPRTFGLKNGSFEETPLVFWQAHACDKAILDTAVSLSPVDGQQYLVVERPTGAGCTSFYQDVNWLVSPDETYHYSIWVRSPDGLPRTGRLALWAIGDITQEAQGTDFTVAGDEWHCVAVALTVQDSQHTKLRSEVYLNDIGQTYLFDEARLSRGQETHCPLTDLFPGQVIIENEGPFYAGSSMPVMAEIRNGGLTPVSNHTTRLWVSTEFNGDSFDTAVQRTIEHKESLSPSNTIVITPDIRLPNGLAPGDYYVVIEVDSNGTLVEANEQNNRHAVLFSITACEAGTVFCDVPVGYEGRPEIELWRELGITVGCNRITTEDGETLFFCPTEKVLRDILAVVIMRHLNGGQYRPEDGYEGLFEDVIPNDSLTPWVEALAREGIVLTSEACPTTAAEPLFCPKQVVTKGDLARYLAEILEWELPATADGTFIDVTGSSLEARAITYMAQQGYLDDGAVDCVSDSDTEGERAFCADDAVTRGHTAVLMVRAFSWNLPQVEP